MVPNSENDSSENHGGNGGGRTERGRVQFAYYQEEEGRGGSQVRGSAMANCERDMNAFA